MKNFDGIVRPKPNLGILGGTKIRVQVVKEDETTYNITSVRNISYPKLPIYLMAAFMFLAFGAGIWYNMQTKNSKAEELSPAPAVTPGGIIPLSASSQDFSNLSAIPDNVLFNLPLGQLESYLNDLNSKQQQQITDNLLAERAAKIKQFLQDHNSPFVPYADVIAAQPHWKLILAISFAESTLGKNCVNNNCSNIGSAPGHPYWHTYANLGDWVVDFNKLLDKKYNNWTLEQMDGVYVQPKSPTWLIATKQILTELQARGIE